MRRLLDASVQRINIKPDILHRSSLFRLRHQVNASTSIRNLQQANESNHEKIRIRLCQQEWIDDYLHYHRLGDSEKRLILLESSIKEISSGNADIDGLSTVESNLNSAVGAMMAAMQMRVDISKLSKEVKKASLAFRSATAALNSSSVDDNAYSIALQQLDASLRRWLSTFLCTDALDLVALDFRTCSGATFSFIAKHESVVPVKNMDELRLRLSGTRRCFALMHPRLPNAPLAYIYAACTASIAGSMHDLDNLATPFHDKDELDLPLSSYDDYSGQVLNHHRAPLRLGIDSEPGAVCRSHKKAIMFYSVNAPHPGLSGLDIASSLIKAVTKRLNKRSDSRIRDSGYVFCTLSPVPGFMSQLRTWAALSQSAAGGATSRPKTDAAERVPVLPLDMRLPVQTALHQILDWAKEAPSYRADKNTDKSLAEVLFSDFGDALSLSSEKCIYALHCILSAFAYNGAELCTRAFAPAEGINNSQYIDFASTKQTESNDETYSGAEYDHIKAIFEVLRTQKDSATIRSLFNTLEKPTMQLCFEYVTKCKASGNQPIDPVSRFHLRNGASFHGMHWAAHMSQPSRVQQSAGILVNYLYDLEELDARHIAFASESSKGVFHINPELTNKYK